MMKALLGTTALVTLTLMTLGASPAQADSKTPASGNTLTTGATPPSLNITGYTNINAYFTNQQRRENGKGGPQPHLDNGVSNLYFSILGKTANGLEYMYRVTLETITGTSGVIDQNYIQIKSKIGTFQFGNIVGPEDSMIWDAGKVVGGTGTFDGAYSNVYNMSAGIMRGNDNIGDTGNTTKIAYYSPELEFGGQWQFGIAYTPSTAHKGDAKLDTTTGNEWVKNAGNRGLYDYAGQQPFDLRNVAIGLTYRKEVGTWSITLSGAGITGKSYFLEKDGKGRRAMQNTKAYQLGFVVGYGDFRFGGGYLDNGKSRLPKTAGFSYGSGATAVNLGSMNTGNAGAAWNVGAGYTMGAYQFGASYQRTNRNTGEGQKAGSDFYSATVDLTPVQGLKIYGEVDYIRSRTNATAVARENQMIAKAGKPLQAIGNNSGLLGIVGTKISF